MSALSRLKQAVRRSIALCGGIEGAAKTVEKSTTHVGRWNALGEADLPTLGDVLLLDEIAIDSGHAPPILTKLASELGHVAIRLPSVVAGSDALTIALAESVAEFGDVARELCEANRDGEVSPAERERIVEQIDEAQNSLAKMRAIAAGDTTVRPLRPSEGRGR